MLLLASGGIGLTVLVFGNGAYMKKAELVETIAHAAQLSRRQADEALSALLESITYALSLQQSVNIQGFGRFLVTKQAARTGRNPQTGQPLTVAAHLRPHFRPAQQFKQAVQNQTNGRAE